MEIPFKYIVLCIIKTLNERKMPLVIEKNALFKYIAEVVNNLFYSLEEKREIGNNFDFQYELDDLLDKYFTYFEIKNDKIIFDIDYIGDLDLLISDEIEEYDDEEIQYYNEAIAGDTVLLDILGVKINKKLYSFLLDIEKEIEECYDDLYALESNMFDVSNCKEEICSKLKKLHMKKIIMFVDSKNILSEIDYRDVISYSNNIVDKIIDEEGIDLIYENDNFNEADVVCDEFLRAIFTNDDSYICNLNESLVISGSYNYNDRCSKVKFYLTMMGLIDREINNSYGYFKNELIKVKYRLMNVLDSVYGTATFVGNYNNLTDNYIENYDFISETVYYFINELLMYDDEKYRNKSCETENMMVYLDNTIKKLLIESYYKLTKEELVIKEIENNKLYGINNISSGFLKDIIENPKVKIKEV